MSAVSQEGEKSTLLSHTGALQAPGPAQKSISSFFNDSSLRAAQFPCTVKFASDEQGPSNQVVHMDDSDDDWEEQQVAQSGRGRRH